MKRIYFLARLGTSDYLAHGFTWEHKLSEHLERLSVSFGMHMVVIDSVETHDVETIKKRINKELHKYKVPGTSLLYINSAAPIHAIMEEYDGETIDPEYPPKEPETTGYEELD